MSTDAERIRELETKVARLEGVIEGMKAAQVLATSQIHRGPWGGIMPESGYHWNTWGTGNAGYTTL